MLLKRFKSGELYLEQCETIPQKGFIYHGAKYNRVRIGSISKKLSFNDYVKAKQSIN